MQSKRGSAGPRRSIKGGASGSSGGLDFGEGEPYLDGDDDVAYLKRFQQFSGTGVKKKASHYNKMSKDNSKAKGESVHVENNYETTNNDENLYENNTPGGSSYGKNEKKIDIEENEYGYIKEHERKIDHDKDSLDDNEDSSDNDIEDEYDLANPTSTPSQIPSAAKDATLDTTKQTTPGSEYSVALQSIRASLTNENIRINRTESMTERLSRDAMSLKRHQIKDGISSPPSSGLDKKARGGGSGVKRDREMHGGRGREKQGGGNREKQGSGDREKQAGGEREKQGSGDREKQGGGDRSKSRNRHQKREESRKRVGDNHNRKSFKATRQIYGEDYPPKYTLPPRSPTFSFRSTIDLLPSSQRKQGLRQQIIVTLSCCLGPLACGFAMGYIFTTSPDDIIGVDAGVWRTYAYFIGCIGGGFFSGLLINLGRKRTLLLTMTVFSLVWLAIIFARELWMILLFHATIGMCTGLVMALAQVYVAEIATPGIRGAISCAPLLALHTGALLCYSLIDILVWRQLAAFGMGITLPFFIAVVLCMPESPRFLVHVRPNDALATLQWLRGVDSDVMDEYRDIADNSDTDRWSLDLDDLTRPTFWRPLLISCGLMFLYSMTGLSSFALYGMELFSEVSNHSINVAYYINTVIVIIGIVISSLLVDQLGRKLMLLLSITIMAASAFTIGLFMFLKDYNKVDSYFEYQWAAEVFCIVLFTFAHGVGMSPIAWITMGEVFGPRNKWIGVTFSSMVFWSSMIAVDVIFQQLRNAVLTGGIFWFHCVMCVGGYIFVLLFFRELKEQRIDDITKSFTRKHDSLMDTFITRA